MTFYFTGTGNSLYAAKALDSELYSIPQIVNSGKHMFEADIIGIVCPIYGHEMPKMVKDFLRNSDFRAEYFYVVLTYGNRHANAVELAEKTLGEADMKADYITTLLMVDNFLPAFDMIEQMKLDKGVEVQLEVIKSDIDLRKHGYQKVTAKDRMVYSEYMKLVGNQPESVWADFDFTNECVGCGICTKVCPVGCIEIENQKAIRSGENCQTCYACVHACPKAAIKMKKIFGFKEKNPKARYRNEHITLCELVDANNQTK